jgi:hypothetical protein
MFVSLIGLRKFQLATATAKNLDLAQQSPPCSRAETKMPPEGGIHLQRSALST